jgi:hypothetical protein
LPDWAPFRPSDDGVSKNETSVSGQHGPRPCCGKVEAGWEVSSSMLTCRAVKKRVLSRLKAVITSRAVLRIGARIVGMCKQIELAQTHLKQAARLHAKEFKVFSKDIFSATTAFSV